MKNNPLATHVFETKAPAISFPSFLTIPVGTGEDEILRYELAFACCVCGEKIVDYKNAILGFVADNDTGEALAGEVGVMHRGACELAVRSHYDDDKTFRWLDLANGIICCLHNAGIPAFDPEIAEAQGGDGEQQD